MDKKLLKKYKRVTRADTAVLISLLSISSLSILAGICGVFCASTPFMRVLFGFAAVCVPILSICVYMIFKKHYDSVKNKFFDTVRKGSLTADEVITLGSKNNLDLFGLALEIRCKKELGSEGIPEWCVRDGVLPTADQI